MRPLGKVQALILESLRSHKRWHPGCGWIWGTYSETVRLLDSLVKRGLATKHETTYTYASVWGNRGGKRIEYRPI